MDHADKTVNEDAKLKRVGAQAAPSQAQEAEMGTSMGSPATLETSRLAQIDENSIVGIRRRDHDQKNADPVVSVLADMIDLVCSTDAHLGPSINPDETTSRTVVEMDPIDSIFEIEHVVVDQEVTEPILGSPATAGSSRIAEVDEDSIVDLRQRDHDNANVDPVFSSLAAVLDHVCTSDVILGPSIDVNETGSRTQIIMDPVDSILQYDPWKGDVADGNPEETNPTLANRDERSMLFQQEQADACLHANTPINHAPRNHADSERRNGINQALDVTMDNGDVDSDQQDADPIISSVEHVIGQRTTGEVCTNVVELSPTLNLSSNTTAVTPSTHTIRSSRNAHLPVQFQLGTTKGYDPNGSGMCLRVSTNSTPSSTPAQPSTSADSTFVPVMCRTPAGYIVVRVPENTEVSDILDPGTQQAIDSFVNESMAGLRDLLSNVITQVVNNRLNGRNVSIAMELEQEDSVNTTLSASYTLQIENDSTASHSSVDPSHRRLEMPIPINSFTEDDDVEKENAETIETPIFIRPSPPANNAEIIVDEIMLDVANNSTETVEEMKTSTSDVEVASHDIVEADDSEIPMNSVAVTGNHEEDQQSINIVNNHVTPSVVERNGEAVEPGNVDDAAAHLVVPTEEIEQDDDDEMVVDNQPKSDRKRKWTETDSQYQTDMIPLKRMNQLVTVLPTLHEVVNETSYANETNEPSVINSQPRLSGNDHVVESADEFNETSAIVDNGTGSPSDPELTVEDARVDDTDERIEEVQDVVEKSMEKGITEDVELGPTSNPSSLTSEFVTPDNRIETENSENTVLSASTPAPELIIQDIEEVLVAVDNGPSTSQVGNSATSRVDRPVHDDEPVNVAPIPTFEEKFTEEEMDAIEELRNFKPHPAFEVDLNFEHIPRSRSELALNYPRLAIPGFTIHNFWKPSEDIWNSIAETPRANENPEDVVPESDPQLNIETPTEIVEAGLAVTMIEVDANETREDIEEDGSPTEEAENEPLFSDEEPVEEHSDIMVIDTEDNYGPEDDIDSRIEERSDDQESDSSVEPAPMAIVVGRVEGAVESQPSTSQSEQNRAVFDGEGESSNNGSASPQPSQNPSGSATTSAENGDRWTRLSAILDKISRQEPRQDVDQYFHNGDFVNPTRFTEVENFTIEGDVEVIIDNEVAQDVRDHHDGHAGVVDDVPNEENVEMEENNVEMEASMIIVARAPPMHENEENDVDMEDIHEHLDIDQEEMQQEDDEEAAEHEMARLEAIAEAEREALDREAALLEQILAEELERERRHREDLANMAPRNINAPVPPPLPMVFKPPPNRRRRPITARNTPHLFGAFPVRLQQAYLPMISVQDGIDALERLEEVITGRDFEWRWNDLLIRLRRLQRNFATFEAKPPAPIPLKNAFKRIVALRAEVGMTTY